MNKKGAVIVDVVIWLIVGLVLLGVLIAYLPGMIGDAYGKFSKVGQVSLERDPDLLVDQFEEFVQKGKPIEALRSYVKLMRVIHSEDLKYVTDSGEYDDELYGRLDILDGDLVEICESKKINGKAIKESESNNVVSLCSTINKYRVKYFKFDPTDKLK